MKNKILSLNQKKILDAVAGDKFLKEKFYLTGGTALAGFYLEHRYSEDLDFFSNNEFDISGINVFFKKNKKKIGIAKIDYQQSYNRNLFFIYCKNDIVKTEFTYFPFAAINKREEIGGIKIESVLDIAVNKLFAIYQRSVARDYIDLYFIVKKYGFIIDDLVKKAKLKFDWHIDYLQLGTQFIKAKSAFDYPRMIEKLSPNQWKGFFEQEAKKLKKRIIKEPRRAHK